MAAIGVVALAVAIAPVSLALDNSWTSAASGKWEDTPNWSLGIAPSNSHSVFITNALTKTVMVDDTTTNSPTTLTVSNITLSAPTGSTNVLEITAGTNVVLHVANSVSIGSRSKLSVSGGKIQVDETQSISSISGEFVLSNGAAIFPQTNCCSAPVTVNNGGTLTIAGGTMDVLNGLRVNGTLWVKDGDLVLTNTGLNTSLGVAVGAPATVTISNGTLHAASIGVGGGGAGTLTVAGGSVLPTGNFDLGSVSVSQKGTLWITGTGAIIGDTATLSVGHNSSAGELIMSNGTVSVWQLEIPGSLSKTNRTTLIGGCLKVGNNLPCGGEVWVNGGELIVTNGWVALGYDGTRPTTLVISNGTVSCQTVNVSLVLNSFSSGRGTITLAGGTLAVSSLLQIGDCARSTGVVFIAGGNLFVTNSTETASLDLRSGTLTLSGAGVLVADRFVMTNSCAQFIRTGGTLIYGTAVLTSNLDADGDGMANGWEQAYGLDPLNAADAGADNDGDGLTNLQEFQTGTDPTNSASAFRILSIVPTNNDVLVTWSAVGGRTNVVQSASDVAGGYSNVSPNIILPGGDDVTTNYLDAGGATNGANRYYKIRLVP